jgi:hypothetical protein
MLRNFAAICVVLFCANVDFGVYRQRAPEYARRRHALHGVSGNEPDALGSRLHEGKGRRALFRYLREYQLYRSEMSYGNNTQCGALSIERVGGVKPDYFWDAFWDDLLFFSWHVPDFGIYSNNFTSWFHFVNLLKTNEDGDTLVTNNYNTYDGYAYNQTYGFPNIGIDIRLRFS